MLPGLFITFEGTEGCGKSTHVRLLADRLREQRYTVVTLREPGGTPIGEEIRHTLKHSKQNHAMTAQTELLLMNASRAQLVGEVIHPALSQGKVVVCDRFFDSTIAYQGYGRQLDLEFIQPVVRLAAGSLTPDLTLLLTVPVAISEARRLARRARGNAQRDRLEEEDREFFLRVEEGFRAIARENPERVKVVESTADPKLVRGQIWSLVQSLLEARLKEGRPIPRSPLLHESHPRA